MREIVGGDEREQGRMGGYIPRDIYPRRRTRNGWKARYSGGLGGSRTKLLKMDEISDLPASGLPARSS